MEFVAYGLAGFANGFVMAGLSQFGANQGPGSLGSMLFNASAGGRDFWSRLVPMTINGTAGLYVGDMVLGVVGVKKNVSP